jgi:hypothetical protein
VSRLGAPGMRLVFAVYLAVIVSGIALYAAVGLRHL